MAKEIKNYTPDFEQFWKGYPSRWNKDFQGGQWVKRKKQPAFQSWQKLSDEVRAKCLRILRQIKKSEGGAVRDAVTWLNEKGWDDIEEVEEVQHLPASMTANVFKTVPKETDLNDSRNKAMAGLKGKP